MRRRWIKWLVLLILLGGLLGFLLWWFLAPAPMVIQTGQRYFISQLRPHTFFDDAGEHFSFTNPDNGHVLRGSFAEFSDDMLTFSVTFTAGVHRTYDFTILNWSSGRGSFSAQLAGIVEGRLVRLSLRANEQQITVRMLRRYQVIQERPDDDTGEFEHTFQHYNVVLVFNITSDVEVNDGDE